ncbi:hypothetical protein WJX72_004318 [[Myrmecia] bisecta]|uniref:Uncharacterized protein n=1 Tax=[Myrmecia] bisecta TaxID=41462 RepID=A0AAW1PL68_9CHLO
MCLLVKAYLQHALHQCDPQAAQDLSNLTVLTWDSLRQVLDSAASARPSPEVRMTLQSLRGQAEHLRRLQCWTLWLRPDEPGKYLADREDLMGWARGQLLEQAQLALASQVDTDAEAVQTGLAHLKQVLDPGALVWDEPLPERLVADADLDFGTSTPLVSIHRHMRDMLEQAKGAFGQQGHPDTIMLLTEAFARMLRGGSACACGRPHGVCGGLKDYENAGSNISKIYRLDLARPANETGGIMAGMDTDAYAPKKAALALLLLKHETELGEVRSCEHILHCLRNPPSELWQADWQFPEAVQAAFNARHPQIDTSNMEAFRDMLSPVYAWKSSRQAASVAEVRQTLLDDVLLALRLLQDSNLLTEGLVSAVGIHVAAHIPPADGGPKMGHLALLDGKPLVRLRDFLFTQLAWRWQLLQVVQVAQACVAQRGQQAEQWPAQCAVLPKTGQVCQARSEALHLGSLLPTEVAGLQHAPLGTEMPQHTPTSSLGRAEAVRVAGVMSRVLGGSASALHSPAEAVVAQAHFTWLRTVAGEGQPDIDTVLCEALVEATEASRFAEQRSCLVQAAKDLVVAAYGLTAACSPLVAMHRHFKHDEKGEQLVTLADCIASIQDASDVCQEAKCQFLTTTLRRLCLTYADKLAHQKRLEKGVAAHSRQLQGALKRPDFRSLVAGVRKELEQREAVLAAAQTETAVVKKDMETTEERLREQSSAHLWDSPNTTEKLQTTLEKAKARTLTAVEHFEAAHWVPALANDLLVKLTALLGELLNVVGGQDALLEASITAARLRVSAAVDACKVDLAANLEPFLAAALRRKVQDLRAQHMHAGPATVAAAGASQA